MDISGPSRSISLLPCASRQQKLPSPFGDDRIKLWLPIFRVVVDQATLRTNQMKKRACGCFFTRKTVEETENSILEY